MDAKFEVFKTDISGVAGINVEKTNLVNIQNTKIFTKYWMWTLCYDGYIYVCQI